MQNLSVSLTQLFSIPPALINLNNITVETSRMNVERCVALHNKILSIGWTGRGRDVDDLGQSWFNFYGEEATAVRDRLSPDLIDFLQQAWEVGDDHSFFYYVNRLHHPSSLFANHNESQSNNQPRYLTLYAANDVAEHPDGLIFDQETNTAIMQMDIIDAFTTRNGRQRWHPLETVLEAWLDIIRIEKAKAVDDDVEVPNPKYDPWINVPYSKNMLEETVEAFNHLVEAIESHMPEQPQERKSGLVDDDILKESGVPSGLAYSFISKAIRPQFKYIAPGLSIPTPSTFLKQPFKDIPLDSDPADDGEVLEIRPILLFRSDQNYTAPEDSDISGSDLPFSWPYSQVIQYPAGLYLSPIDRGSSNPFEDEAEVVLPFGIGGNGYARTSDGARFGENTEDEDVTPRNTHADLYQPGYQPFGETHKVRLASIFKSWLGMIERGDWKVDGEGVVGGIGEWRKADTLSGWQKFVIPIGW